MKNIWNLSSQNTITYITWDHFSTRWKVGQIDDWSASLRRSCMLLVLFIIPTIGQHRNVKSLVGVKINLVNNRLYMDLWSIYIYIYRQNYTTVVWWSWKYTGFPLLDFLLLDSLVLVPHWYCSYILYSWCSVTRPIPRNPMVASAINASPHLVPHYQTPFWKYSNLPKCPTNHNIL